MEILCRICCLSNSGDEFISIFNRENEKSYLDMLLFVCHNEVRILW